MSAGNISGTLTAGAVSGTFIGVTGAVEGGGDVVDPDDAGRCEAVGQLSSLNIFVQLFRQDFSGFADVTMSEVEAWLYHAARSPAISWISACGLLCPGAG